ncbi:MAG: hypothetical protein K0Q90_4114 [Paenibacillaceae bacterium]|nr:hypothetical protein [Paenibacillaceae bacterium]
MALVFARQPILDRNNRIYGYELCTEMGYNRPTKARTEMMLRHKIATLFQQEKLVELIEKDVAFTFEILKIANSIYYYRGNPVALLCDKNGYSSLKTEMFTMGLLSMIDNVMSLYFRLMLAFEQGEWDELRLLSDLCGIATEQVMEAYTGAVIWANRCDLV